MIVDSCIDQVSREISVLQYLDSIGVDVQSAVRLVVGTHAHDDHIAGLSEVLAACEAAKFVCSSALTSEEFYANVIEPDADIQELFRMSIRSEYRKILEILETREPGSGLRAVEQRVLWTRAATQGSPEASVIALSPSDHAVTRAIQALSTGSARTADRRRLAATDPNEFAVALTVSVGDSSILLGADLLAGPSGCGWGAVLGSFSPDTLASIYKIPHHGAPNAHHDGVWSQLVAADVISLIAPYRAGRTRRPAPADITRIKSTSKAVYCSAKPDQPTPSRRLKKTRASLAGLATNVREWGTAGHVQARRSCSAAGDWEVRTFAPALEL